MASSRNLLPTTDSKCVHPGPILLAKCLHAIPPSFQFIFCTSEWTVLPVPSLFSRDEHWSKFFVQVFCSRGWLFDCGNDFANRHQKSLFGTFQSHSFISSITSGNELQCHSSNNCAKIIFLQRLHAACIGQRATARLVSTPTARCTHGHPLQSVTLCDHSMICMLRGGMTS